ncbi:cupin domain-containing protein [uncultured Desulfobacter sp.]|uniref:cupin domain-containing protein n=1 Tax=uncultured Desulfobacter sp. TaxID=240139 RepID=UPI002AAB7129|nr:cupin domain-containing protein [uncultured Desulfobacter sp.]
MFAIHDETGYVMPVEGIKMKTLVYGDKTLLVRFKMTKGALLPAHSHPHEQTGYLVSGSINLYIGSECHKVGPDDSWCIGSGVEHRAEILEDSVAIEVFSPVREDYLP